MICRVIAPTWLQEASPDLPRAIDGDFNKEDLLKYNSVGYNIYYFPNHPSAYVHGTVNGSMIDTFNWVFIDIDFKDGVYSSMVDVYQVLDKGLKPTKIVNSGNGAHAYWRVSDLDALTYLRIQRRLMRLFDSDPAVAKICQLMRLPGYKNTKDGAHPKPCEVVAENDITYSCEQLDKWLPKITTEDEDYCQRQYSSSYNLESKESLAIDDKLPIKFCKLLKENPEIKDLFTQEQSDRSKSDYRLGALLYAEGFTREDALKVLVNCRKAMERAPAHRLNYGIQIVDKIWADEATDDLFEANSVRDILNKETADSGERLHCWDVFDGTEHGFRLTEVLGLVGPAGGGKTTLALNYFYHFAKRHPEYHHLFVSLEQPEREIALRWKRMAEGNTALYDKVHVLGNYNPDGTYRNLSLAQVEDYIVKFETKKKVKIGCVVIDHIGILKKQNKEGDSQSLIDICLQMKAVAVRTKTFLVMQSQTARSKAGIGDIPLDKDAAYGTTYFEWFVDYLVTTWQPLKRVYAQAPHMTCSAFKYCKIRHKNVFKDKIKEDSVYVLMFDPDTELLRLRTQLEAKEYDVWDKRATADRNKDRKRDTPIITKIDWVEEPSGNTKNN